MIDRIQKSEIEKSTLVKSLKPDLQINFSDERTLIDFAGQPSTLPDLLDRTGARSIFIDEVQRLPSILNTVQALIDAVGQAFFHSPTF